MKKFILERHIYSPEQNKIIFFNGASLKTPGCSTIQQVKQKYFQQKPRGLFCVVDSVYHEQKYKFLNRYSVAAGKVKSRKEALEFARTKLKQNGGTLKDGSILPPNSLKLNFKYW